MTVNVEKMIKNGYSKEDIMKALEKDIDVQLAAKETNEKKNAEIEQKYFDAAIPYFRLIGLITDDISDEDALKILKRTHVASTSLADRMIKRAFF